MLVSEHLVDVFGAGVVSRRALEVTVFLRQAREDLQAPGDSSLILQFVKERHCFLRSDAGCRVIVLNLRDHAQPSQRSSANIRRRVCDFQRPLEPLAPFRELPLDTPEAPQVAA